MVFLKMAEEGRLLAGRVMPEGGQEDCGGTARWVLELDFPDHRGGFC